MNNEELQKSLDEMHKCLRAIKYSVGETKGELTGIKEHLAESNHKTAKNIKDIEKLNIWKAKVKARITLLIGLPAFTLTVLSIIVLIKNW